MAIAIQLPSFTTASTSLSRVSTAFPLSWKCVVVFRRIKMSKRLDKRCLRVAISSGEKKDDDGVNFMGKSHFVEVIGIGSRKDAVLDFCADSPFQLSSSLRFWNISVKDEQNVQLQERFLEKDVNSRILETSKFLQSCSMAIILVASAGYGLDHVTAVDILRTVRTNNGVAVAIFLRPFSFEGQRRQEELKDLVGKLQEYTNFCIDIDTDTLLKKDLVTLDEALKTANTAVLLAINAILVLISGKHKKIIDVKHNSVKELKVSEVMKTLQSYKKAKIGFGSSDSIKSSILQALCDCPFIGVGVEKLNGIIICILASSSFIEAGDVHTSLLAFRQTAEYTGEIIISTTHEPNLDPNMIVTTVVAVGEVQTPRKSSLLSRLAQHFPFISRILRRHHEQSNDTEGINELKDSHRTKALSSPESDAMDHGINIEGIAKDIDKHSEKHVTLPSSNYYDVNSSSYNTEAKENEIGLSDAGTEYSDFYNQIAEEAPGLHREPLISWNLGPGYQIAQEWAKERAEATLMLDNLSIFRLPVGIRPSGELKEAAELPELKAEGDVVKEQKHVSCSISSWGALTDAGFLLVRDFYNNASTKLKGRNTDVPKKPGVLSVRAASMLEAERDSSKKWSPVTEMLYRGGVYKGRCQGGLPEGKGRLILEDGSIYDGMWRYGKRSGPGTFYFSNGDVFQGSWRDDMMHGKGWFYFHTGDRWFANFWKGKANGESRFYSKSGEVFFGQFQDGWRQGHFLCIDVGGARYVETWDEGVLVGRKQLDSDSDTG